MSRRIAVVLFNLGGPDRLSAVRPFLFNLFNDPAIIGLPQPFRWLVAALISTLRTGTAKAIYSHMGGASPLLAETEAQRTALEVALKRRFSDDAVMVTIAMRYWRPFTADAARAVERFAPDDIVLLPLYPQYSTTTTGSSIQAWRKTYGGRGRLHSICCYPQQDGLIQAHVRRIKDAMTTAPEGTTPRLLFSAHGLPQKVILEGDPYQHQVERTAAALAQRLGACDWQVCYQSRVGPMQWIGPSTIEAIEQAGRDGVGLVVIPVAFVSEHSETLVELDLEYRELAMHAGVPFYLRARTVGIEGNFIEALAQMTCQALEVEGAAPQSISCREGFSKCPFQQKADAQAA